MNRILVFAPNWLGDAVMAVPSVDAIRRQFPSATLAVAARTHLAALYELVPGVDEVLRLEPAGRFGGWLAGRRDARRLRDARFDLAILLPNSFRSAWIARRAGIAERWGYATDGRAKMLTRAVPPVHGVHQVEYYQRLLEGLGVFVSSGVRGPRSGVRSPGSTPDFGLPRRSCRAAKAGLRTSDCAIFPPCTSTFRRTTATGRAGRSPRMAGGPANRWSEWRRARPTAARSSGRRNDTRSWWSNWRRRPNRSGRCWWAARAIGRPATRSRISRAAALRQVGLQTSDLGLRTPDLGLRTS